MERAVLRVECAVQRQEGLVSQGGRIAAITRGSDPRNSGSNPDRPTKFVRVVKLDWHHATNVERWRFESSRGHQSYDRVAQLESADVSEASGRVFESPHGHQFTRG